MGRQPAEQGKRDPCIPAYRACSWNRGSEEGRGWCQALFAGGADTEHMPTTELAAEDFDEEGNIDLISLLVKSALVTTRSEKKSHRAGRRFR